VCLEATAGAGKSALFAKLHGELDQKDIIVLAHAAGISPQAGSVDAMLKRWIEELAQALNLANPITEESKAEETEQTFSQLLHQASNTRRVVVLIDALNQFEASPRAQHLTWLPKVWPENARLIATAIPGAETEALTEYHGVFTMTLRPLGQEDAEVISKSICARYRRTLNPDVLKAITGIESKEKEPACGNPLWLTLAVEELNLLDADDFARAERQFTGTPEQKLHQLVLTTARDFPPTVPELYGRILDRVRELHGKRWADGFASLIAVSRLGWREQDFQALLPKLTHEPWDPLKFATLRRTFRAQVTQRGGQGQWDFAHAQLREAVLTQLLPNDSDKKQTHKLLADHLLALPKDDPVHESETMVHLIQGDDKVQAAQYFGGDLTAGEATGATGALAGHIVASGDAGLNWVCALVHTETLDAARQHGLCNRINFCLHDALVDVAPFGIRRTLLQATEEKLRALIECYPLNPIYQRDLSVSQGILGDVLRGQGQFAEAIAAFHAAHAIRKHLADKYPADTGYCNDLAQSHSALGDMYRTRGQLNEAMTAYRASQVIVERLAAQDPLDPRWQHNLSVAHRKLGNMYRDQGQLNEAAIAYRASHDIAKR